MFSIVYASIQNVASIPETTATTLNPWIAYVISPAVVFSVLLFFVGKIFKLGEMKEKIYQSAANISNLDKDVKKLLSHMDIVKTHLVTNSGLAANLFSSSSPLKLLEKGTRLLEDSGFKEVYENNKEMFISEIRQHGVKTLVDVDEASFKVLDKFSTKSDVIDFRNVAFKNGVSREVLLKVLSVYLREEVAPSLLNSTN